MKKMKLKVGDRRKILSDYSGHNFRIGTMVRIIERVYDGKDRYYLASELKNKNMWYVGEEDFKRIKKKICKKCDGEGFTSFDGDPCNDCNGTGEI